MTLIYNSKIPKNRIVELESPKFGLEGRFKVELIRKVGDKEIILRELPWQKNMIVNSGLDKFFSLGLTSINGLLDYCAVGTGSTAPAATDVGLVTETGVRSNSNGSINDVKGWAAVNEYFFQRRVRLFTELQSNGNLTEFGFFTASSAGTMFSRQLFKDGGGIPTTIVKTSADQLRITYEARIYPPTVDTSGNIVISGTNYTWTGRALAVGVTNEAWEQVFGSGTIQSISVSSAAESQTLAATTAATVSGAGQNASTSVWAAYVNGNFYADRTDKWEPGVGNYATGIGLTLVCGATGTRGLFQTSWNPKFAKDNTKRLTLVTRISWARH